MTKTIRNGAFPETTISLVQLRAGQLVGSTYHTVRHADVRRKSEETVNTSARSAMVLSPAPYLRHRRGTEQLA